MIRKRRLSQPLLDAWLTGHPVAATHRRYRLRVWRETAAGMVIAALGALPGSAAEGAADRVARTLVTDVWQTEDGLPQNSVFATAQTPDGYLWLGTEEGLVRFDGVRFTVFDRANTPVLQRHDVRALAVGRDGSLWIGTNGGGLARRRDGTFTVYTTRDGLAGDEVFAIAEDGDGALWVGTTSGLSRFQGGAFATYRTRDGLPDDVIACLRRGRDALWIGTRRGLTRFQRGSFKTFTTADGLPIDLVHAILEDRHGRVWVGTEGGGVARLEDGAFTSYTRKQGLSSDFVYALLEDHEGVLWIGTHGGGLNRLQDGRLTTLGTKQGLSSDFVQSLIEDTAGSLWLGTNAGGLNRLRPRAFSAYTAADGLASEVVLPVLEDRAGSLWIGTAGGGLNRLMDGRFSRYTTRDGLPHDLILSLAEDREGSLWVGTPAGLARLRDGVFRIYTTKDGLSADAALALHAADDGSLWIGTNTGGLNRLRDGRFEAYREKDGLPDDRVWAIERGAGGRLWIATDGGLALVQDGRLTSWTTKEGLTSSQVYAVHEDTQGTVWIGTAGGGLNRLKDGRLSAITTKQGLFDDLALRILEDDHGNLWMSSNKGVFRARKKDLDDLAEGRISSIVSVGYGKADGMPSAECNGGVHPAGWRTRDGRLWFPTIKGLAVVDPREVRPDARPFPAVIEEVLVDGEPVEAPGEVRLAPGARRLEVRYTVPGAAAPEKLVFRHRLEGFDDGWVPAGKSRMAQYTSLRPGRYVFHIAAAGADLAWDESPASVRVRVDPRFQETPLFFALCLAGAAVAGGILYRLHATGTRARVLGSLVDERTRDLQEAKHRVEDSEAWFRALIQNGRDIVFVVGSEGRFLYASPALHAIAGLSPDEVREARLADLVHPGDAAAVEGLVTGGGASPVRFRFRHRDGPWRLLEAVSSDLRNESAVGGVVLNARDVTEQQRLEEQFQQAQKMEAIGQLAGGVAHDFNNLLSVILGYTELLLRGASEDRQRGRLEEVRKAAQRAAALTGQLLAFSRKQVPQPRLLDLNAAVLNVEKMLRRLIGEDIQLVTVFAEGLGLVSADPGQVEQVIMNLAVNGRDAMPRGGRLTIETDEVERREGGAAADPEVPPGRYAVLAVSDTGHGMDAEVKARIFEPFFTTKERGKGTGLGLSTVYGIVTQGGGHVTVESEPGRGTTFRVYLPRMEQGAAAPEAVAAEGDPPRGSETIVLVEDDPALRSFLAECLRSLGYAVIEGARATQALEACEGHEGPIGLLVTDVVMPGMGGRDLAERLATIHPEMRVLYVSGYMDDAVVRHGVVKENVSFLQKPFTGDTLARKVREVLDGAKPSG